MNIIVVLLFLARGIFGLIRVRRKYAHGYIQRRAGISWFVIHDLNAPFTLFRNIYLDPKTFKRGFNAVIRHEMVHARQLHSVDLLVMEFACAILWFNPFIFLLRRYIRDNHEYLADQFASGN